jgi:hypothetical protein
LEQKRVAKMEEAGAKWAQEGAGKKKMEMEKELENIVRGQHHTIMSS